MIQTNLTWESQIYESSHLLVSLIIPHNLLNCLFFIKNQALHQHQPICMNKLYYHVFRQYQHILHRILFDKIFHILFPPFKIYYFPNHSSISIIFIPSYWYSECFVLANNTLGYTSLINNNDVTSLLNVFSSEILSLTCI